jgi:uncharacterized membrane protein (DUF373 family)
MVRVFPQTTYLQSTKNRVENVIIFREIFVTTDAFFSSVAFVDVCASAVAVVCCSVDRVTGAA